MQKKQPFGIFILLLVLLLPAVSSCRGPETSPSTTTVTETEARTTLAPTSGDENESDAPSEVSEHVIDEILSIKAAYFYGGASYDFSEEDAEQLIAVINRQQWADEVCDCAPTHTLISANGQFRLSIAKNETEINDNTRIRHTTVQGEDAALLYSIFERLHREATGEEPNF
jgi:hypothetical protein